jgi:3-hydroxyisobutyrate dehydrogenase-like beta-hydroxyacid dehydrogenase
MAQKPRVGFIGLGMMGKPAAHRVLAAGYPLTVHDVRSEPMDELVRAGAIAGATPAEVAQTSDIVLTSLPTIEACESVYFGKDGLLQAGRRGLTLVETSTVTPRFVRTYAEEGAKSGTAIVDAALLGRTTFHPGLDKLKSNEIVAAGLVTVMMGGDDADVARVKPVIETFGNPIYHMGALGAGEMIKVLNNAMSHAYYVVALEVISVAAKSGVDMRKMMEIFRNTSASSCATNDVLPHYLANGSGKLMNIGSAIKDADAMLELARAVDVPVLMQNINHAYYEMAIQRTGTKTQSGDGELAKLFEGFIHMPLRY